MLAIQVRRPGDLEELHLVDLPVPRPGSDEVLLRVTFVGVNFVDVQHRRGAPYPVGTPFVPGIEAVGEVVELGADVTDVQLGARVAVAGPMAGWYAEFAVVSSKALVPVPDDVPSDAAAAVLLQGMTVHMLTEEVTSVRPGDVAVVLAASGGVGSLLVQRLKQRGAVVIGTVSRDDKRAWATEVGCDHVIVEGNDSVSSVVRALTRGAGADVVFDSVGGTAFREGLRALRARGHMVSFGQSGGRVPPFDPAELSGIVGSGNAGSLTLSWPTLNDYNAHPDEARARGRAVLEWVRSRALHVRISHRFHLRDAANAHRLLEERRNVGKIVLYTAQA